MSPLFKRISLVSKTATASKFLNILGELKSSIEKVDSLIGMIKHPFLGTSLIISLRY